MSEHEACKTLGVSGSTYVEYRRDGLSELVADRMAVKAGLHPFSVWPEMADHHIEDAAVARRARDAERVRRYRATPEGREATRRANRAHYRRVAEYARGQSAKWRAENPERVREINAAYNARRDPEVRRAQTREATRRWRARNAA